MLGNSPWTKASSSNWQYLTNTVQLLLHEQTEKEAFDIRLEFAQQLRMKSGLLQDQSSVPTFTL